jgi:hypothetical protein
MESSLVSNIFIKGVTKDIICSQALGSHQSSRRFFLYLFLIIIIIFIPTRLTPINPTCLYCQGRMANVAFGGAIAGGLEMGSDDISKDSLGRTTKRLFLDPKFPNSSSHNSTPHWWIPLKSPSIVLSIGVSTYRHSQKMFQSRLFLSTNIRPWGLLNYDLIIPHGEAWKADYYFNHSYVKFN